MLEMGMLYGVASSSFPLLARMVPNRVTSRFHDSDVLTAM